MEFFTSPEDLRGWVKIQDSPDSAAKNILEIIGMEEEQDVVDTCRSIFETEDEQASKVLFGLLAKHNMTEIKESSDSSKMQKEAQIYRGTAPLYDDMPMRVCPKLPKSVGRVVNTIHCRDRCLDSIFFDDDPKKVYCAEALWRRHVADKFSREFKNEDGKWVGGYINERFQVYYDDGGNPMQLANGERTRLPRPHQYSTERRLEEARGEKTTDIFASDQKMVKVASKDISEQDDPIFQIFSDSIDMKEAGLSEEDVLMKLAEHYDMSIPEVAQIVKIANSQMQRHAGTIYACSSSELKKKASVDLFPENTTLISKKMMDVLPLSNPTPTPLEIGTNVVLVSNGGNPLFQIVSGPDAGAQFNLNNSSDVVDGFGIVEAIEGDLQSSADELGLNEDIIQEEVVEEVVEEQPATEQPAPDANFDIIEQQ